MDNEGDELELRRVLKTLEDEPDAADAWRRYHLMRSLMRRETEADMTTDLSAGIMARLEEEPAPQPAASEAARRSLPLGRSAGIAAAVSLMVITGVQFYNGASPLGGGAEAPVATNAAAGGAAGLESFGGGLESLGASAGQGASLVDMPMYQTGISGTRGLMTVGAGAPMVLSPAQRQSLQMDQQQALLLQSYLERHAEGAAASGGDPWMPLLRASGSESLGPR